MLILTRKIGESVFIGNEIAIKVLSVDGKYAKIGFNAPRSLKIIRDELVSPDSELFDLININYNTSTVDEFKKTSATVENNLRNGESIFKGIF